MDITIAQCFSMDEVVKWMRKRRGKWMRQRGVKGNE
jgi:hypothetical protein